jgi:hypothetical protein
VEFLVIDGCPVPEDIAPYVRLVLNRAHQTAGSIYRGEDAKTILHRHGKHTQAEIHRMMPTISNPPGFSQHELRSDGVGNPNVPRGGKLEAWQVGVDSGSDAREDRLAIRAAANHFGWEVKHPYSRGVEGHHWCFATRPRPTRAAPKKLIEKVRAELPRR